MLLQDRLVRRHGGDRYYTLVCVPASGGVAVFCRDETERVRREQALLEEETRNRNMAVMLQRSLLPQRIIQPDEIRLAACYLPALVRYEDASLDDEPVLEVGGDWYDAIPLGAGRTALVVGGVTPEAGGVGVRAAAVMGRLRAAVRAYASQNLPPGEVMYHLDRHALDFDGERTGSPVATLVYAVHDADSGSLTYANAGHLPPLLRLPDGYVAVLDGASGPSLGSGDWTWQEAAVAVPPGSYLAFYTQGLLERGTGDLRRVFARAPEEEPPRPGAGPVDLVRDHILASIDPLSVSSGGLDPAGAVRTDDVALLVAHVPAWTGAHAALFRSASVELVGGPEIAAHARSYTAGVLTTWGVADGPDGHRGPGGQRTGRQRGHPRHGPGGAAPAPHRPPPDHRRRRPVRPPPPPPPGPRDRRGRPRDQHHRGGGGGLGSAAAAGGQGGVVRVRVLRGRRGSEPAALTLSAQAVSRVVNPAPRNAYSPC